VFEPLECEVFSFLIGKKSEEKEDTQR